MIRKIVIAMSAAAALAACSKPAEKAAEPAAPVLSPMLTTDAPAGEYKLDPAHASVTWKITHMGLSNYTARFTKIDATLNFDPADPAKNSVSVKIDPASVRTDYPYVKVKGPMGKTADFDKELSTDARFFNSAKFPEITFKSTGVERTGENTAKVTGDLTLLGVTKPITLDATFNGGFAKHPMGAPIAEVGFSGVAVIKRSEFGMGFMVPAQPGAPGLSDDVTVLIEAEFTKPIEAAPAPAAPTNG
jgi:polyisoprenoid-binding protein YceI